MEQGHAMAGTPYATHLTAAAKESLWQNNNAKQRMHQL